MAQMKTLTIDGTLYEVVDDTARQHISNENNPHRVTATQVGAPTVAEMNAAIAAIPTPDVSGQISTHDTNANAHSDIRLLVSAKQDASTAINTNNISQQSVNYATSAGSATTMANSDPGTASLKNIQAGTNDIGAGSLLATGTIYLVYE